MLEAGEAADTLEGHVLPWVGEAAILRGIGLHGFLWSGLHGFLWSGGLIGTAQHLSHVSRVVCWLLCLFDLCELIVSKLSCQLTVSTN